MNWNPKLDFRNPTTGENPKTIGDLAKIPLKTILILLGVLVLLFVLAHSL